MNQEDWENKVWKFWEYTDDLDEVRNENFSQVFPELSVLMKDYTPKPDWRFIPTGTYPTE